MPNSSNRVQTSDARTSTNYYQSDLILRHYLAKHASDSARTYLQPKVNRLGEESAIEMNKLSRNADRYPPELKQRNKYGEASNEVVFHPDYHQLVDIAARSEMFYLKYEPDLRKRFTGNRQKMCFAAGQLYAMSELGVYCPLCMTDGAAHLVDRYAPEDTRKRLLPRLSSRTGDDLYTGAMFLTEKAGGSDVGANLCTARKEKDNRYLLYGEKWFCSNVNAEVIMTLARTGDPSGGTRGLSLFLIEKRRSDGRSKPMQILRLKDKLGVRSMATGEVLFEDTVSILLGKKGEGFKLMTEMINISRLYNSVAAIGGSRRAIVEAWQYLNHRKSFGRRIVEHALVRDKFMELGSRYLADFLLVWRTIRAMDAAETGNQSEEQLLRILVPMAKWRSAESSVYIARECMELMGGNGYIEDFVMPRLLRDINVLPIWEGSGNIIALDILRAAQKSEGLQQVRAIIQAAAEASTSHGNMIGKRLERFDEVWQQLEREDRRESMESTAKPLFTELINLLQLSLMVVETDDQSRKWLEPAAAKLSENSSRTVGIQHPPDLETVAQVIGWEY